MNLNMLLKLGNFICTHADFAKFIYKTLDICSQQNNNNNDNNNNNNNNNNNTIIIIIHVCIQK